MTFYNNEHNNQPKNDFGYLNSTLNNNNNDNNFGITEGIVNNTSTYSPLEHLEESQFSTAEKESSEMCEHVSEEITQEKLTECESHASPVCEKESVCRQDDEDEGAILLKKRSSPCHVNSSMTSVPNKTKTNLVLLMSNEQNEMSHALLNHFLIDSPFEEFRPPARRQPKVVMKPSDSPERKHTAMQQHTNLDYTNRVNEAVREYVQPRMAVVTVVTNEEMHSNNINNTISKNNNITCKNNGSDSLINNSKSHEEGNSSRRRSSLLVRPRRNKTSLGRHAFRRRHFALNLSSTTVNIDVHVEETNPLQFNNETTSITTTTTAAEEEALHDHYEPVSNSQKIVLQEGNLGKRQQREYEFEAANNSSVMHHSEEEENHKYEHHKNDTKTNELCTSRELNMSQSTAATIKTTSPKREIKQNNVEEAHNEPDKTSCMESNQDDNENTCRTLEGLHNNEEQQNELEYYHKEEPTVKLLPENHQDDVNMECREHKEMSLTNVAHKVLIVKAVDTICLIEQNDDICEINSEEKTKATSESQRCVAKQAIRHSVKARQHNSHRRGKAKARKCANVKVKHANHHIEETLNNNKCSEDVYPRIDNWASSVNEVHDIADINNTQKEENDICVKADVKIRYPYRNICEEEKIRQLRVFLCSVLPSSVRTAMMHKYNCHATLRSILSPHQRKEINLLHNDKGKVKDENLTKLHTSRHHVDAREGKSNISNNMHHTPQKNSKSERVNSGRYNKMHKSNKRSKNECSSHETESQTHFNDKDKEHLSKLTLSSATSESLCSTTGGTTTNTTSLMTVLNAICEDKMYMHGFWSRHNCNHLTLKERCYTDNENENENENNSPNAKLMESRQQSSSSTSITTANELPKRASVWRQLAEYLPSERVKRPKNNEDNTSVRESVEKPIKFDFAKWPTHSISVSEEAVKEMHGSNNETERSRGVKSTHEMMLPSLFTSMDEKERIARYVMSSGKLRHDCPEPFQFLTSRARELRAHYERLLFHDK